MCIIFPITVRLLQNNERGFPLIFTITVVEMNLNHSELTLGTGNSLSPLAGTNVDTLVVALADAAAAGTILVVEVGELVISTFLVVGAGDESVLDTFFLLGIGGDAFPDTDRVGKLVFGVVLSSSYVK
jgi:hypothetical protein